MPALTRRIILAAALLLLNSPFINAHEGEPLEPHDLWSAWTFPAGILIPLLVSAGLYLRGVRRSRVRRTREIVFYAAGWIVLALALVSPIHPLGEALFSVHMVQHAILMLVAAPLLVLGRPLAPYLLGLPRNSSRSLARFTSRKKFKKAWAVLKRPLVATALQGAILWVWHVPALYERTLDNDIVHSLQHLSFLFSALLFWWVVLQSRERRGAGILSIFITAVHTSVLGALLVFAPVVWYPVYAVRTAPWGLLPLQDQQLAGLVMWVPGGVIYTVAGLGLMYVWIRESDSTLLSHSGAAPTPAESRARTG